MTVSSTLRKAGPFNGNGVTTAFPFAFKVFAKTDIKVVKTDAAGVQTTLVLDSDYSLALNVDQDASPGGTITYPVVGSPLPIGQHLDAVGSLAAQQPTDITNLGNFLPQVHEDAFDRGVILAQQLEEKVARTVIAPVGDGTNLTLPTAAQRANKTLCFDDSGNAQTAATPADAQAATDQAKAYRDAAQVSAGSATTQALTATAKALDAANFAAAAATGAKFYNTIALGNAGVADAATFGVIAGGSDGLLRPTVYRRESAGVSTALYSVLPASEYDTFAVGYIEYEWGPPLSTTGNAGGANTTYVNGDPFAQTGYLGTVTIPAQFATDTYTLSVCTKSGSTFTPVATKTVAHTLGTPNVITDWHPSVTAGVHYLAIDPATGAGRPTTIQNLGSSIWFRTAPVTGGACTQLADNSPQFTATVRVTNTTPIVNRVAAVEAVAGAVSGAVGTDNTLRTLGPSVLTGGTAGDPAVGYINGQAIGFTGTLGTVTLGAEHPAGSYRISLCTKSGSTFSEVAHRAVTADGVNPTVISDWNPAVIAGTHYLGIYASSGGVPHYKASTGASQWFKAGYPNGGTYSQAADFQPLFSATILQSPTLAAMQRIVALEAGAGGGVATTTAPAVGTLAPGDKVTMLTNGSWNGMIVYGQSLAEGFNSTAPISTTQPYSNRTFGSGTRSGKAGNIAGAVNTSPGTSTTISLVEDAISPSAAGFTGCGETVCSGATTQLNTLAAKANGIVPTNLVQLASVAAHGSYPINSLKSGATWYNQLLDHITEGIARAKAAGVDYQLSDVPWIQGEADADAGTSRATYLAALLQLRTDIETSYRNAIAAAVGGSITAKANAVHMLIMQVSSWGAGATLPQLNAIQLAQRDACLPGTRMHMVGPGYPYPRGADKVHLTAVGELRAARQFGRARKQLLIDGKVPDRFKFVSAWASGTSLTIQCDVPTAPIVIDTTSLAACTNNGILVKDDTGTLVLSGIAVSGNQITMTLNRSLGANPKFRYALDFDGTSVIGLLGSWGNLRDSTADTFTSGSTYPMYHWAPHAELDIGVVVG